MVNFRPYGPRRPDARGRPAARFTGLPCPKARIEELFRIFETDQVGVDNGKIVGIVSKIDVLEFMSRRGK